MHILAPYITSRPCVYDLTAIIIAVAGGGAARLRSRKLNDLNAEEEVSRILMIIINTNNNKH